MKGEKRPRLPRREDQDIARNAKVVTARRREVFSREVRCWKNSTSGWKFVGDGGVEEDGGVPECSPAISSTCSSARVLAAVNC